MVLSPSAVIDMINGRWRSQILYAGVELGVFERLPDNTARNAESIAREIGADPALLYRLLRALSSINLLREDSDGRFSITDGGQLLRSDHPHSLRAMALLEERPVHYANWRHLPAMIRSGVQDSFRQEFGMTMFEYLSQDPRYAADEECQRILSVVRKVAKPTSTLMSCEWIVPGSDESHFAKIVDIAMLCLSSGRQRTVDEFAKLLSSTGWAMESMRQLKGSPLAILKAAAC
jgi:hypothetical protein